MKKTVLMILAMITGGLLGFFGVFVSVFADGSFSERLITIAVILVIYGVLGFIWGFLYMELSWKWGFFIGAPGGLTLLFYTFDEQGMWLFSSAYLIMIFVISCLGGYHGAELKRGKGVL